MDQENSERQFLHDIASPLSTAMYLMDSLVERAKCNSQATPEDLHQMNKIHQALQKLHQMLKERRNAIF